MIKKELLLLYGAQKKTYSKAEIIFNVNDIARYFYQIEMGEVKIFNQNENGKEFIQSILSKNRIFGEVALLGDFNYPTKQLCGDLLKTISFPCLIIIRKFIY